MKATGIVRRIDDLGRIVIPKEIRRTLRIREGDPLEIFTDREGKVILKKYSPIGELGTLAGIYADSLSKTLDCTVCITDTDQVIAAAGNGKKELQEMLLSAELAEVFQERKTVLKKSSDAEFVAITKDRSEYSEEIISVILSEGDIAGGVIFLQKLYQIRLYHQKKIFLLPFFHLLFYHCIKCLSLIQQCTLCILSSIFNHNSFQSILIINHCITIKSRKMIIHLVCNCFYYINKFCITFYTRSNLNF